MAGASFGGSSRRCILSCLQCSRFLFTTLRILIDGQQETIFSRDTSGTFLHLRRTVRPGGQREAVRRAQTAAGACSPG